MRFNLATIAYVFALVAAAMATFGLLGFALAIVVLGFGSWVWRKENVTGRYAVIACISMVALVLIIPMRVTTARNAAIRNDCLSNLKQISVGLMNYEAVHGAFPPPYLADKDGKPMHSWRVLILPYMEQQQLYGEYDFNEPWDGPNNRRLWDKMPSFYACPSCAWHRSVSGLSAGEMPRHTAHYVAVVGPETAWPVGGGVSSAQITDGTSNTALVMEYTGSTVPWTAPVDLTLEEAVDILGSDNPRGHHTIEETLVAAYVRSDLRLMGHADGHGKSVGAGLSPQAARAILTISGNEPLENESFWPRSNSASHEITVIQYDRVFALSTFVALALLPGVLAVRRFKKQTLGEGLTRTTVAMLHASDA